MHLVEELDRCVSMEGSSLLADSLKGAISRGKMLLKSVSLSGFRGYRNEISIPIDAQTTTVIGRNDAGKSSLFEAMNIFFGGAKLEPTDFTVNSNDPVVVSCTFSDLPSSIVIDSDRSTSLADEYLLTPAAELTVVKTWTRSKLTTPTMAARANHPVFDDDGIDLLNAKLPTLRSLAKKYQVPDSDIDDRRTSSAYRQAIWAAALRDNTARLEEIMVPLTSEDGKSVGNAISSYMPQFHLFRADRPGTEADELAQDPAKAAIKAVLDEYEDQLEVLSRTVQAEVKALLADVVDRLAEVAPDLAASLRPTDPRPSWNKAFGGLQFIDENDVPLSKRGSGTRRLVLLSFFRATAEKGLEANDENPEEYRRGVITAVEEPETALHADLQTDIISALQDVGELPHRQVLLTTHSANLIRLVQASSIRYITGDKFNRRCVQVEPDGDAIPLLTELNRSLGIFTDHNVRCFILVEGRNDVDGLRKLTDTLAVADSKISAFAELELKGLISFMPIGGGGNASLWASNLSPFRRDEVHIMDSDRLTAEHALKPEMVDLLKRADSRRHVFVLDRRELENYLTIESIISTYADEAFTAKFQELVDERGEWDYLDIPSLCAEAVHSVAASTNTPWEDLKPEVQKSKGNRAKKRLVLAFAHQSVSESLARAKPDLYNALLKASSRVRSGKS
ncbi:ATP-binding protein [Brevibacterium sp. SIMBA_078]|uniref:ATP-binding protein n=1 Tax=Brevibacterium sp. SIMBA_078 TaxID=3085816 RepID=UPI003979F025